MDIIIMRILGYYKVHRLKNYKITLSSNNNFEIELNRAVIKTNHKWIKSR